MFILPFVFLPSAASHFQLIKRSLQETNMDKESLSTQNGLGKN
jgi:hypothetical protein